MCQGGAAIADIPLLFMPFSTNYVFVGLIFR